MGFVTLTAESRSGVCVEQSLRMKYSSTSTVESASALPPNSSERSRASTCFWISCASKKQYFTTKAIYPGLSLDPRRHKFVEQVEQRAITRCFNVQF